ncbi:MAG: hypothetical protein RIS36_1553 [Pseudomonadota bacterium]|jgi:hypothetical protein
MKLTAGEIYFIGEKDLKTGLTTSYCKIGIVRDGAKGDRSSDERLLEHQTGNPRKLFLRDVVRAPAAEEIETRVHRIFAPLRVNGEWLDLADDQYREALEMTYQMSKEAEESLSVLQYAESLKEIASNGKTIEPPTEIIKTWNELNQARAVSKLCALGLDTIKKVISTFAGAQSVEGIVTVQERKGRLIFDQKLFEQEHPELFTKYQSDKVSWKQRFNLSKPKETPDVESFSPGIEALMSELDAKCQEVHSKDHLPLIHAVHVQLLSRESKADWVISLTEARLKAALGENEGFEGICKWNRGESTTKAFDPKLLETEMPELYQKFVRQAEPSQVMVVQPMVGY